MGPIAQKFLSIIANRKGALRFIYIGVPVLNLLFVLFDSLYLREMPYSDRSLRDWIVGVSGAPVFYDGTKGISTAPVREWLTAYDRIRRGSGGGDVMEPLKEFEAAHLRLFETPVAGIPQFKTHEKIGRAVGLVLERLAVRNKTGSGIRELHDASPERFFEAFDREIVPLAERAYHRSLNEEGKPVDLFYTIDRWFALYFLIELLGRGFYNRFGGGRSRFIARNWTDLFFIYPPQELELLRYMRIVPLYFRIRESLGGGRLNRMLNENNRRLAESLAPALFDALFLHFRTERSALRTGADGKVAIPENLEEQLRFLTERVLPSAHREIVELLNYSATKAAESWLLSPLGPIARFLLVNFNIAVKDAVEAALLNEKGQRRLRAVLERILIEAARGEAPDETTRDGESDSVDERNRTD